MPDPERPDQPQQPPIVRVASLFRDMQQRVLAEGVPRPAGFDPFRVEPQEDNGPATVGELCPDTVDIGRQGSSLLGALSMAIMASGKETGADVLFHELSRRMHQPAPELDSPKRSGNTLQRAVDFLRFVTVEPLLTTDLDFDKDEPLLGVFAAIHQGSAVILPVDLQRGKRRRAGKIVWGAVTGYREEIIADETPTMHSLRRDDPEQGRVATHAHFAVGIAFRNTRTISSFDENGMKHQLDNGRYAYVVSRLER